MLKNYKYFYANFLYLNYMVEYILQEYGKKAQSYFIRNYEESVKTKAREVQKKAEKEIGRQGFCTNGILALERIDTELISKTLDFQTLSKNDIKGKILIEEKFLLSHK